MREGRRKALAGFLRLEEVRRIPHAHPHRKETSVKLLLHFSNDGSRLHGPDPSLPGLPGTSSRLVLCHYAHISRHRAVSLVTDNDGLVELPAEDRRTILDGIPYGDLTVLPADPTWLTHALSCRGVSPRDLADEVITASEHHGFDVNAAGLYRQVEYLLSQGWVPQPLTTPQCPSDR
ncbi:MAG: hypothetical protein ACOC92_00735 [bacterium]